MSETPVVCLSSSYLVQYDYQEALVHKTVLEELYDGSSQRRGMYAAAGRRAAVMTFAWLTQTEREVLEAFLLARRGKLQPFYFYLPDADRVYPGVQIGTTAGYSGGTQIQIPFTSSVVSQVYDNGTPLVGSPGFTQQFNVGTFGEDAVTITPAVTAGHTLTADLVGRLRVAVRSDTDQPAWKITVESVPPVWSLALPVVEV